MILKQIRADLKLTQEEFSKFTGVPRISIARAETARQNLSIKNLKKVSKATGYSIDELLNDTPDPTPTPNTTSNT